MPIGTYPIALANRGHFIPVFWICMSLIADPDPGFYLNADPILDSEFRILILIERLFCQKKNKLKI